MNRVAVPPFVDGLFGYTEPFGQDSGGFRAGLKDRPHFWRRRRLTVKMDQHALTSLRMSLRIDLAMKKAERRGSM
jgi:hypothetical protein